MIKLFRWLNILLVLVTLLCYLSPYVPPARFSWLGILGTGYPILFICHVFFLLFWAWQWKNYWWYSALALLTGVMYLGHFFGIQTSPVLSADNIRIATYNIGSFYNLNTGKRPDTAGFNRLLWATDADVLCLQEVALKTSVLDRHLKKYRSLTAYPYRFWQKGTSAVIFSKFPIVNQGQIKLDTYVNGCIFVDLNVHGRKIRVYAIHLQSNKITVATNDLASEGDLSEKETWSKAKHIVDRVRNVAGVRARQAAIIKVHQEQSPHPAVICGDFNETPLSYTYRQLSAGMQDAFYSAGSGLGFTYSGKYPFLALDYILADRTFNINYSKVVRSSYSDHYLVVSDMKWNK